MPQWGQPLKQKGADDVLFQEDKKEFKSLNEPLTQADLDKMDFDKVWISYGPEPDNGEWALVYGGQLYSIDTLEGAGFEGMLRDLMAGGETLDNPTGAYTVHRHKPKCIAAFQRKLEERIDEAARDLKEIDANSDGDFINYDAIDHFHFLMGLREAGKMLDNFLASLSSL